MEDTYTHSKRIIKEKIFPFKKEYWKLKNYSDNSIMSLNLRADKIKDNSNNWIYRRDSIIKMIKHYSPDIICCQEAMPHMVKFLKAKLGCNYDCYGVDTFIGSRIDKIYILGSLGNVIFFNKNKYKVLKKSVFWLADKTCYPNNSWGSKEPRNCISLKLKEIETNKTYTIFSTHFDHISKESRDLSTKLLIKKADSYKYSDNIFFVGDFNATISNSELSEFSNYDYYPKQNSVLTTYNGFGKNKNIICDYIISNKNINARFEQITDGFGIKYLSDHYPMIIFYGKN